MDTVTTVPAAKALTVGMRVVLLDDEPLLDLTAGTPATLTRVDLVEWEVDYRLDGRYFTTDASGISVATEPAPTGPTGPDDPGTRHENRDDAASDAGPRGLRRAASPVRAGHHDAQAEEATARRARTPMEPSAPQTATTDGPTDPEVVVPEEALARLVVCDIERHQHDRSAECVAAIAVPVLVAELRRLAGRDATRGDLQARADQLESWGRGR